MTTEVFIYSPNNTKYTTNADLHDALDVGDMFVDNKNNYYLVCDSNYGDMSSDPHSRNYLLSLKDFMIYDYHEIIQPQNLRIFLPVRIVDADIKVMVK